MLRERKFKELKVEQAVNALKLLSEIEIAEERRSIEHQWKLLRFWRNWVEENDSNDEFVTSSDIRDRLELAMKKAIIKENKDQYWLENDLRKEIRKENKDE